MRVLSRMDKLDDCLGLFLQCAICACGSVREIDPDPVARPVDWGTALKALAVAPRLLAVRQESCPSRRGREA